MNLSLPPESVFKRCSLCVLARGLAELVAALATGGETGTRAEAGRPGAAGPELTSQRGLGCDSEASVRDSVNAGLPSPVCGLTALQGAKEMTWKQISTGGRVARGPTDALVSQCFFPSQ